MDKTGQIKADSKREEGEGKNGMRELNDCNALEKNITQLEGLGNSI